MIRLQILIASLMVAIVFPPPFCENTGLLFWDHSEASGFSVDFDCRYVLTNQAKLHSELLKKAVADSQKKAAAIAEVTGQHIIGIDSMSYNSYYADDSDCFDYEECVCRRMSSEPFLSDQLEAPITTERETVNVVWLIE